MLELLLDAHVLYEVHGALFRQGELTTTDMIGGVLQDIDVTTESEVHLVVGQEMEMDTTVAINLKRILDVETVEIDGILTYRGSEGVLYQTNLVVVKIDISKHLFQYDIQNIARLEEVVQTR